MSYTTCEVVRGQLIETEPLEVDVKDLSQDCLAHSPAQIALHARRPKLGHLLSQEHQLLQASIYLRRLGLRFRLLC